MKHCIKCNEKFNNNTSYCMSCGKKLLNKENYTKKINSSLDINRVLLLIIFILSVSFIFIAIGNTLKVPYVGMVTYMEKVPVTEVQEYKIDQPYLVKECNLKSNTTNLTYIKEWGDISRTCIKERCTNKNQICISSNEFGTCQTYEELCSSSKCQKYRLECKLDITNTDTEDGIFSFQGYAINKNHVKIFIQNVSVNVTSKETISGIWNIEHTPGDEYSCWYTGFIAPSKSECQYIKKYKSITKTRDVNTKEQYVEKQKEIVRYKTFFEVIGLA
jgi:hypothetical protein